MSKCGHFLSVVLLYLIMHQIPCALGYGAHLSAWWEEGAFCVEHEAVITLPSSPLLFHCLSGWAWGLMAGLSSFASQRCSLHLGANRGSLRMSQAPNLHLATQLLLSYIFHHLKSGWNLDIVAIIITVITPTTLHTL